MPKGFHSIFLALMIALSVAFPGYAEAGPPWVSSGLDNLTINAGDSWAYLDPSVMVDSSTDDFREGYVEVDITDSSAYDQLQLANGGSLTVNNGVVFYDNKSIGMIDSVYNGTNGHLKINFSATVPLTNARFEIGSLAGWTVDYTHNQVQGQSWAVTPEDWNSCSAGDSITKDSTPTIDEGIYITDSASVQSVTKHADNYALQMHISGHVTYGCGMSHSPSILSSAFTAQAGDRLSLWYNAVPSTDASDVYGFVINASGGRQLLFHSTGTTGGWVNIQTAITTAVCPSSVCNDLQFEFINGTFDSTGSVLVGSDLYIDDIEVTLASLPVVTNEMVEAVVENIQYRNTQAYPDAQRQYSLNFKDSTPATGSNQAQITIVLPAPAITGITPSSGPFEQATRVVITGTNLNQGVVTFGGTTATCTVDSPTQITCTSPALAAGVADVVVTTPGGSATVAGGFTYRYLCYCPMIMKSQ